MLPERNSNKGQSSAIGFWRMFQRSRITIDVFSKDGCEMVDILFDRFLKKYYADIDVSNERMTINLTDEEGHVLSFNLSQSEVHYVLHMVERRLNSFMRDDGGGGFSDED